MSTPKIIRIPERGSVDIDSATFAILKEQETFWRLVSQRIISFSQPSPGTVRLQGSCFVGKVHIDELQIEVVEKVEGALGALLGFATYDAFRVERLPSPSTDFGSLIALLVKQFLDLLHLYVSRGRSNHYEYKRFAGSLAGGRINILKTIGLRARGLIHQLVFDRPTLTHSTLQNRILSAALMEVSRISQIASLPETDLARARGLSLIFEDCRDSEVLVGDRAHFANAAHRLSLSSGQQHRDLLALAAVLLSRQSFEFGLPVVAVSPRAWFLNLETLFEVSVRRILHTIITSGSVNSKGEEYPPAKIFINIEEQYSATPDLVISQGSAVTAVGDVKYKEWDEWASHSDIYQLLVHAAAYNASLSFLVYPHDSFSMKDLGISATGARTWLIAIDVRNLEADLLKAMTALSIL